VLSDNDKADGKLETLKEMLLELDSLPPLGLETPTAAQERNFAKEVFEYSVILSINQKDREKFQRYMSCLKPYYINRTR
jgi:hypothetical protein